MPPKPTSVAHWTPSKLRFPDEDGEGEEERVGTGVERTRCCANLGDPKGLTRQPDVPAGAVVEGPRFHRS